MPDLKAHIAKIASGTPLTAEESCEAFDIMMSGEATPTQIGALLMGLRVRSETVDEIRGAVMTMRSKMLKVQAPEGAVDIVGTGGDGAHTYNISTLASIIVAGCGVPVAKHGNRAASSKAGSSDTLEALGLNLDRASETAERSLADIGIGFLFAQKHHPALGKLAGVRKAIGRRTIFNLTGPLCNPAGVKRQLLGVARPDFLNVVAGAIELLGLESAMLVAGDEPLDELSVCGPSTIVRIGACGRGTSRLTPEDVGLSRHPSEALRGGDAAFNAAALRRLLLGEEGAYRDAVLLNAAAALVVAGCVDSWENGVEEAREALDNGVANTLLDCWIAYK